MFKKKVTGAVLAVALSGPFALLAQGPPHPHYYEALRNLQFARAVLAPGDRGWGPVSMDQRRATGDIDHAIEDLRHALAMEGRNPNDVPPVDMHWEPRDRLRRASEALMHAREALGQEEFNRGARVARDRAFHNMDDAQHALHHAMEMWR